MMKRTKSKVVRIIVAFCFVVNMLLGISLPAQATGISRNDAVTWAAQKAASSWWQDVDNAYGCQCVDLVRAYYSYLGVGQVAGHAYQYMTNTLPNGWTRVYANPRPGDICVWKQNATVSSTGGKTGSAGHVGIVIGVSGNNLTTVETNWNTGNHNGDKGYSNAKQYTRPAGTVSAYIRPNFPEYTKAYSITFAANGGKNAPAPINRYFGKPVTFPSEKPVKPGYEFVGWLWHSNGTNPDATTSETSGGYAAGQTADPNVNYGNICWSLVNETYVAVWKPCEHVYDDGVIAKYPSATSLGEIVYTCQKCSMTETEYYVGQTPEITKQPSNITKVNGSGNAVFSVTANGTKLSYQWYWRKNSQADWAPYGTSGSDKSSLSIEAVSARNGFQYYCCVLDPLGNFKNSDIATLTVVAGVKVTKQPASVTKVNGSGNAVFSVAATGTGLSYQWYWRKNSSSAWTAYGTAGSSKTSISIDAISARNGFQYYCEVKDAYGNKANSSVATLTVVEQVKITKQPSSVKAIDGSGNVTFSVSATGTNLKYQWYWRRSGATDWTAYGTAGSDKNSITIGAIYARNGFQYRCEVTDAYSCKAVSTVGTLTVVPAGVTYRTHVQTYGWQTWKNDGEMSGTSGESKRLEGIEIKLNDNKYSGGVRYKTHVQTYGWQGWKYDGAMSGTSGESKRLEAISIELYGDMANKYDIYYRVHCQTYGWLAWAKNGEYSGSAGMSKRLEGIQVVVVPKGNPAPGVTYKGITAANSKAYLQN